MMANVVYEHTPAVGSMRMLFLVGSYVAELTLVIILLWFGVQYVKNAHARKNVTRKVIIAAIALVLLIYSKASMPAYF